MQSLVLWTVVGASLVLVYAEIWRTARRSGRPVPWPATALLVAWFVSAAAWIAGALPAVPLLIATIAWFAYVFWGHAVYQVRKRRRSRPAARRAELLAAYREITPFMVRSGLTKDEVQRVLDQTAALDRFRDMETERWIDVVQTNIRAWANREPESPERRQQILDLGDELFLEESRTRESEQQT